jgi:DNA-binding transcriptional MerR regulator
MKSMEEQHLSQKLSELCTTGVTNEKGYLINDLKLEIEKIPTYLTKRNASFKQIMHQALSTIAATATTDNNNIEELRKITIVIYKIMIIQTYHLLWTVYLKSGTGQLVSPSTKYPSHSTTVPIWPKAIKNITKTNDNEVCLKFVKHHLHELDQQLKQFQTELNLKANHFRGYTLIIQKNIETYIEQNLQSLRTKIEHQIELIHYDYHIGALKLEYFRHKPNEYQVCFCQD